MKHTEYSDSLSDGGLDLLIKLIDADVVYELLNASLFILAFENSSYFNFNENIIESGTRFDCQFKYYMLLSHEVLNLCL